MIRKQYVRLIVILFIVAAAMWVNTTNNLILTNPFNNQVFFERNVTPRLGLDLQGGLQVLMEADLDEDAVIEADSMKVARDILESRTNALGVAENTIQVAGDRRIVAEFPGLEDTASVLETLQQTGLLEFVDMGTNPLSIGKIVNTDFSPTHTPDQDGTEANPAETAILHTVMTGRDLATVGVGANELGGYYIGFTLTPSGQQIFADYTTTHVGQYLGIVLDKQVISTPRVDTPITAGEGIIQGSFDRESANALTIQLRYGSLPIPLEIVETRIIGPTLGEDSLQKSLFAGVIGMIIVILFMALYYRLPGLVADVSIMIYAAIAFALFKYVPITLTLPAIAGFLLSTGAALDANILIFERLKEELRNGMTLNNAVERGWTRAWPSIRDSNIATLITSAILFWFGSSFGATIVKGFSLTLALGVIISLFTAIVVTRTLLALVLHWFKPKNFARWFGT
ncbi:MAG: protein translocase subunit SecD [Chloroflexota bacterium]